MVFVAGVDEAGKGPVVGPMCVAGVAIEESRFSELEGLGIKDSKKISKKKREVLSLDIKAVSSWYVFEVEAYRIDELRKVMTMNEIVLRAHAKVIDKLKPDKVFVDAADVNANRFGKNLEKLLECRPHIVSEHHADDKYLSVSAASIIAKVSRDDTIRDIENRIGRVIGSGYPSDRKTRAFVMDALKDQDEKAIRVIRHSWKTTSDIRRSIHL